MTGGLWRNHSATLAQRRLFFPQGFCSNKPRRKPTQVDVLLAMLRDARAIDRAVELPEIMQVGIAQHGARMAELRQRGFLIENELERLPDGSVFSRYWLRYDPEMDSEGQP